MCFRNKISEAAPLLSFFKQSFAVSFAKVKLIKKERGLESGVSGYELNHGATEQLNEKSDNPGLTVRFYTRQKSIKQMAGQGEPDTTRHLFPVRDTRRRRLIMVCRYCGVSSVIRAYYHREPEYRAIKASVIYSAGEYIREETAPASPSCYISTYLRHSE